MKLTLFKRLFSHPQSLLCIIHGELCDHPRLCVVLCALHRRHALSPRLKLSSRVKKAAFSLPCRLLAVMVHQNLSTGESTLSFITYHFSRTSKSAMVLILQHACKTGDSSSKRPPMEPGLQDWEHGTPPGTADAPAVPDSNPIPVSGAISYSGPGTHPLRNPEPGIAEEPAVPDSNPIMVPSITVAKKPAVPNSDSGTPSKKSGLQDLHLIPVPIAGGGPPPTPEDQN